jgi:hypothetical protein
MTRRSRKSKVSWRSRGVDKYFSGWVARLCLNFLMIPSQLLELLPLERLFFVEILFSLSLGASKERATPEVNLFLDDSDSGRSCSIVILKIVRRILDLLWNTPKTLCSISYRAHVGVRGKTTQSNLSLEALVKRARSIESCRCRWWF